MEIAALVLEYLKVFLSAPVITGAVAVVAFFMFGEDIRGLLRRIAKIKLPGGGEFSTSQIEKSSEDIPARGEQPPISKPTPEKLPENLTLSPDQQLAVKHVFEAERATARLWEYRYLNYFLARGSQRVLDWLAALTTRTTVTLFDAFWLPVIPRAEERRAIIQALQAHYLIAITGELIEVTPKGKEYLQWRGPLPAEIA